MSMYTSPIMLSWTTQLELTLEMPGVDTSPLDIEPTGVSWATFTTSGVSRQAITLAKPQGGVGAASMPMLLLVGKMLVAMGLLVSRMVGL